MRLILASGSPRRADLLRAAGFAFDIVVTNVDEQLRPGETAAVYVRRLAGEKSAAAQSGTAKAAPHDEQFGTAKAVPYEGGLSNLAYVGHRFSGAEPHSADPRGDDDVIVLGADTVVAIDGHILGKAGDADAAAWMLGRVETTAVQFATLPDAEVAWYVASGDGRDKAGAYAIQGLASRFISRIEGSYSNVVGLPVAAVHELLSSLLASRR
jgi:septum formation protein